MEKVFKWLTTESECDKSLSYIHWFARSFEPVNFEGIDRLMMCYIKYCAYLSIPARRQFFEAYIKVDGKKDIKKYNIKVDSMTAYDYEESSQLEEAYRMLIEAACQAYDRYIEQDLTDRDFKVDMHEYMSTRKSVAIQDTMMKFYPLLMGGNDVTDVNNDMQSALHKLDDIWDLKKLKTIDRFSGDDDDDEDKLEYLCKTGIPCIDGDIGGVYDHLVYTFTGQPGAGKTRFGAIHFCYKLITEAKCNVAVYNLELSKSQYKNILIAYHISRVYRNGQYPIKIPDSLMNKKDGMSKQQKAIYEAAKIDLFESGKYGSITFLDELVVESYEQELIDMKRDNPNLRFVIVDYAGFAKSKPTSKWEARKQRYEIITDVYDISVAIKKMLGLGFLILNQFTDEGITAALAGKKIRSGHVQGGQVIERHSDYDIMMTMTEEQEAADARMLSLAKKRGTAGFGNALIKVDLSISIFRQEEG